MSETRNSDRLRRTLGPVTLTAYGLGDILGAGIYALIGEVAAVAGPLFWVSFLVTVVVVALTALSYAELGGRFPRSGGEAYFTQQAFRRPSLALLIGWLVLCSGIVSLATVSRAFAGYLLVQFDGASPAAETLILAGFLLALGGIAFWGIRQSSTINVFCTIVEASGLLMVIVTGALFMLRGAPQPVPATVVLPGEFGTLAILQGSALAFFAFIGFEDMVNVAEEVKTPRRHMPVAILAAIAISGVLYILIAIVAVGVVPPGELASSKGPLLEVVRRAAPWLPSWGFSTIALFAVANTGLLNLVMGSRLLYGMSDQQLVPAWLGRVHSGTRTPHLAIVTVMIAALLLALSGTLRNLAGTTNTLIMLVFLAVNLSLFAIKRRLPEEQAWFQVPLIVPVLGAGTCSALVFLVPAPSLWSAGIIIGLGLVFIRARLRMRGGRPAVNP